MDEARENNYVNLSPTWRDAAAPLLAVGLSLLFWAVFALEGLAGSGPGLGVFVFTAAYFGAVLLILGPKTRWNAGGVCLMAAALALAVCCWLYAHPGLTVLNCFVILVLSAGATFSLSGQGAYPALELRSLPEAARLSVLALFTRVDRPFRLLRTLKKRGDGSLGRAALTLTLTAGVLAVVLSLLASADTVFKSLLPDVGQWFSETLLWKIFRTAVLALFISSGLYFIREPAPAKEKAARPAREKHAGPFLVPAAALDAVYLVFCAVQIRYLFGGAEAAAMAGGWAAYARTGFFQLAAVAAINLTLCLAGTDGGRFEARGGAALRIADGLLLALTAVILLSAARRMQLYILAFGLSVLRLVTLWGMLVIAVGLFAAGWKLARPGFAFCPVFCGFALAAWCLFCLCSPAGMAANYNVNAWMDGRLEELDVTYLESLSADAAPALRRAAEDGGAYADAAQTALDILAAEAQTAQSRWPCRKVSFQRLT